MRPQSGIVGVSLLVFLLNIAYVRPLEKPILMWTQSSHIWSKLRGFHGDPQDWLNLKYKPYIQSNPMRHSALYAIGFDPVRNDIYWSDRTKHTVSRQKLEDNVAGVNSSVEIIFLDEKTEVQALAVDWLTGNVYFTEGTNGWIAVISGRKRQQNVYKILFSANLFSPRGIAVDPKEGLIFWCDKGEPGGNGRNAKIERATTDGQKRVQILNSGTRSPHGITLDRRERKIYWVDPEEGFIKSMTYDGQDQRTIVAGLRSKNLFGLALYNDYLFVTTEALLKLNVYSKSSGSTIKEIDVDAQVYHTVIVENLEETSTDHECTSDKTCGHLCLNTGDKTGICDCSQGYYLQLDGTTCSTSSPKMIYSVGSAVLSADVLIEDSTPHILRMQEALVAGDMDQVEAIGFHYEKDLIYYSDTVRKTIYWSTSTGQKRRELTVQTGSVQGISVDWTAGLVYWTDESEGHIMCSRFDGRYHAIHKTGLQKPRGIAIDPIKGKTYLVGGDGSGGYVQKINIEGGDVENIITTDERSDLQSIAYDPRMERLYWSDGQKTLIEYSKVDGSQRSIVSEDPDFLLYGLTLFQDYISWTEGRQGLQFGLVRTGNRMESRIDINNRTDHSRAYGVVTFDVYLQPETQNGCTRKNGGCAQLCYPAQSGVLCGCAIGFTLNSDGKRCDSDVKEGQFAFFVDPYHKQVYQTAHGEEGKAVQGFPVHSMEFPISVDFDSAGRTFVWIDRELKSIRSRRLDGDKDELLYRINEGSQPEVVCVDPFNRQVYYSDSILNGIYKMNMDGKERKLIVGDIVKARAFAIDYKNGMMYWVNGDMIEQSLLDGTEREMIVDGVNNVSSIAFYPQDQMLYYTNQMRGQVFSKNVSSEDANTLFTASGKHINSIAVSENFLYFVAWNDKGVYRVDRETGQNQVTVGKPVFARIMDIRAIDDRLPASWAQAGTNVFIYIAAAAAALFLFLLLLLIILLCRRCAKKRRKLAQEEAGHYETPDDDSAFDPPITGTNGFDPPPNGNLRNGHLPSTNTNGLSTSEIRPDVVPGNGYVPNGHAMNGNGHVPNGYQNSAYVDDRHTTTNGGVMPPAPILAAPPPIVARKAQLRKKPKPVAPPPEDNRFELSGGTGAQATMIQRLANRLRKGISSIRWSGHGGDPSETDGGHHHKGGGGRSAKDMANRKKRNSQHDPSAMVTDGEGSGNHYVGDVKPKKKEPRKKIDIPPNTHKMPRGFAPASHCVPVTVKSTWGKAKGKQQAAQSEGE